MIKEAIIKLAKKQDLYVHRTQKQSMNEIMSGGATPVQMSFII